MNSRKKIIAVRRPRLRRTWKVAVTFSKLAKTQKLHSLKIERFAKEVLKLLNQKRIPKSVSELSLYFVNDSEIKKLNRSYRRKSKPTDVLSFSLIEGAEASVISPAMLGDIVISTQSAKRDAASDGVSFEETIKSLIVHGILHLFGYEHEGVARKRGLEMFKLQQSILHRLADRKIV